MAKEASQAPIELVQERSLSITILPTDIEKTLTATDGPPKSEIKYVLPCHKVYLTIAD